MKIKKFIKQLYIGRFCSIYSKQYAYMLKVNNIPNAASPGEEKWGGYWKTLGVNPLKETYRVFYQYMGDDFRILPETTCHYVIEPILNPEKMVGFYSDKNFFERILPAGFCPKTILRKIQGHYYDCNYQRTDIDSKTLDSLLDNCCADKIIVKPSIESCSGNGVELFCKHDGGFIHAKNNGRLTYDWLEKNGGSDFILQEAIVQSDFMSQFCDTSVNTLRLAVYRSVKDEECHVIASVMRIGSKGNYVDNGHAGGRFVGISKSGKMSNVVFDQYGVKQNVFNGVDFSKYNFNVPNWDKIVGFAKEVGKCVPHHRLLALDVAIQKNGEPILIEYNINGFSMWIFQFTGQPALGEYTEEIKEYCEKHLSDNTLALYI